MWSHAWGSRVGHDARLWRLRMDLPEYVGNVHIFLGPYRGNPIALYLRRGPNGARIAPNVYPWNRIVGEGDTPNRAAADFEEKWKAAGLPPDMYTGPHWEGGIKPEKPAPPKAVAADAKAAFPPKPAAAPVEGAPSPAPNSTRDESG